MAANRASMQILDETEIIIQGDWEISTEIFGLIMVLFSRDSV